ncbi:MAG: hypothetical protein AVDCRST_MAG73-665, partial [uncultured Thermomicrobiales bacterium]
APRPTPQRFDPSHGRTTNRDAARHTGSMPCAPTAAAAQM